MSSSYTYPDFNSEEMKHLKEDSEKYDSCPDINKEKTQSQKLMRRLHILTWIGAYNGSKALADLIAGLTLGMTMIPQGIAYAALAGVSSQYGLFSSFVGSFVYVILGTIPQVSIGPTSLMALLTLQYTAHLPVQFVVMLALLSGIVELLMGVFNLGFIVNFISTPVTSAFTTGTSTIVILVQLKTLLGIKEKKRFFNLARAIHQISLGDTLLGLACLAALFSLRQMSRIEFDATNSYKKFAKRFLWYLSISRNAIVVLCSSLFAYNLVKTNGRDNIPFALSARVNTTMPNLQLPPFIISFDNTTLTFMEICKELGSGILVVPLVAVLANVAIAKAFVKDSSLDASQEMFTLGVCNIAGSFFHAMPTCGAFTRSAVSHASGVKTPMSGIYTGGLVLLALCILTPYFEYIPKSALSAVLIAAVSFMLDFRILNVLWSKSKKDFFNWIGVYIVSVLGGVELGLFFGIIINIIYIMIRLATPKIEISFQNVNGQNYIHVVPRTDIYYAGAETLRNTIKRIAQNNNKYPIVIDCKRLMQCDYTLIQVFVGIIKDLEEKNIKVYLQAVHYKTKKLLSDFECNAVFCYSDLSKYLIDTSMEKKYIE